MKKHLIAIAAGLLLWAAATSQSEAAELRWVGCAESKRGFMDTLAAAYEEETGSEIRLEALDVKQGILAIASGGADMGGSGRHKLPDDDRSVRLIPVAWDALVAVVHTTNPVKNISLNDLRAVFNGTVTNWRELGGADARIEVVVRQDPTSAVGLLGRELLFHNSHHGFPAGATQVESSGRLEKRVAEKHYAIALSATSAGKPGGVSMLSLDDTEPTYQNVAAGKYPLARPLYLIVPKSASDQVKAFAKFATKPAGQESLKRAGTINIADGAGLWTRYRQAMTQLRKKSDF